ncbi:type I glyceraldehyde-3-phosphate dehydrogenase [Candidatus Parcubacteria bacterium]|jgi:glyceraldehyde 3-phosphate dehydrogenase|nr:type I glyceraldehyde-3-phosphate dehydrogenase [Candidatus Parcubacteria bacterium]
MSKVKVAINGFGRIGRHSLKVAWDKENIEVVAINDLTDNKTLAHLLKHDTAYPDWGHEISYDEENLIIDGKKVKAYSERDPSQLPWKDLGIDVVMESTGVFRTKEKAGLHLEAGAKKVVLSAPGKGEGIETYVRGINCGSYKDSGAEIIDNASCTTNCTAPVMRVMEDTFGVEKAMLTTIHSYTADQNIQDGPHKDLRRSRAAAQNMVPTSTGAAVATTKVVKEVEGVFDGIAVRVPTITVSLVDFSLVLKKDATVEEINEALTKASQGYLKGILDVTNEPLVSSDFIGNAHSSIADLGMTKVVGGNLVKIISWYDNEWGYANRLVEMVEIVGKN